MIFGFDFGDFLEAFGDFPGFFGDFLEAFVAFFGGCFAGIFVDFLEALLAFFLACALSDFVSGCGGCGVLLGCGGFLGCDPPGPDELGRADELDPDSALNLESKFCAFIRLAAAGW